MALEAWVAGLSAGSSVLTGGPGDALAGEVGPVHRLLWIAFALQTAAGVGFTAGVGGVLLFSHRSKATPELARTRGIRLFN